MSIKTDRVVQFDRETLFGVEKIGFSGDSFVVHGYTTPPPEPRGTYSTSVPISDATYRRKHPAKSAYRVRGPNRVTVYDDWGRYRDIIMYPEDMARLIEDFVAHELPEQS